MTSVTLDIDTDDQAFILPLMLSDKAYEFDQKAIHWNEHAGNFEKDAVYQRFIRDARWLRRMAKDITNQLKKIQNNAGTD